MVTRRLVAVVLGCAALAAVLAYLHDPPWLIDLTTGLRRWEQPEGDLRYRWSAGHASFFVPASAGAVDIPLSTTFTEEDHQPMMVTISVDDDLVTRVVLTDAAWRRVRVTLPPPEHRKVRRIDIRTNVTRDGNHGVRVGELDFSAKGS